MRIKSINARSIPPVDIFEVGDLSDLVVIAGPNGVGKSRLVGGLLGELQKLSGSNISFIIESTSKEEEAQWGKRVLDTTNPQDRDKFTQNMMANRTRRLFRSGVLYYESNRTIQNLKPVQYLWEYADPWTEKVPWASTFGGLANRFQDTIDSLFKKLQEQKSSIASKAIQLKKQGKMSMNLDFSDPLDPFKEAFKQLLGPKELDGLDTRTQKLMWVLGERRLSTDALSSGEREVLNIAFDFILRRPSDCVIFFDEPELHLHPELAFKLISTLRSSGDRNQFILCSHSPDIIASSLGDTVVCLTPPKAGQNQAVPIDYTDESAGDLSRLGHSVGVIALGKKIVFVEGDENSLDKKVYSHITRKLFPNLVVLPARGKDQVGLIEGTVAKFIKRAIWGIDFYFLCDRDAVPFGSAAEERMSQKSKVRLLPRYHLENYFLDAEVIAEAFKMMAEENEWRRDPTQIDARLLTLARDFVPYAVSLIVSRRLRLDVGNIDTKVSNCHGQTQEALLGLITSKALSEGSRIDTNLSKSHIEDVFNESWHTLSNSLEDGSWKRLLPGKPIVSQLCNQAGVRYGEFINMYLGVCDERQLEPLKEIVSVFSEFDSAVEA